jgi:hypothetical protein
MARTFLAPFVAPLLVAGVASALLAADVVAQTPPASGPRLGLGDYMTAFVQPRHAKLGLGGQVRNWDYLSYEQHELEETLEKVEKAVPRYRGANMADLLGMLKQPMADLQAAIQARDGAKFDAAYAALTDSCNACHRTTEHAMVVIQVPKAAMFPDQNFAPAKQ